MDAFWGIVASNAAVATVLAAAAMLLGCFWKNAAAVHLLWVAVLLKLFTPPLITTGVPSAFAALPAGVGGVSHVETGDPPPHIEPERAAPAARADLRGDRAAGDRRRTTWGGAVERAGRALGSPSAILAAIWICGTCGMAAAYAFRIRRFAGVVRECEGASPAVRAMVARISGRLGLRRVPDVLMTSRALPPLVWSIGPAPRVILPSELFGRLGDEARGAILAHELCHIRRGDHLVRLLELASTAVFWWHPVVRWASWQLRELEERCCDSRVLELVPQRPRAYAEALVDTLEFLSERPRTPVP